VKVTAVLGGVVVGPLMVTPRVWAAMVTLAETVAITPFESVIVTETVLVPLTP
jgi:hypothetical protein